MATINDLSEFVREISRMMNDKNYLYVFRGHQDKKYKLLPSIYRNKKYLMNEEKMFKDFVLSRPEDFRECHYTFDYLAKMQHYGLPTRLLDITFNPLVALYFAVCKNANAETDDGLVDKTKDGVVICIKIPKEEIKTFDSDTVSILANASKLLKHSYYSLPTMCPIYPQSRCTGCKKGTRKSKEYCPVRSDVFYNNSDNKEFLGYLQYEIKREKPHFNDQINPFDICSVVCVKAKLENPRVINQKGGFLLFGINEQHKASARFPFEKNIQAIKIPGRNKLAILNDLTNVGINHSYIYPEMENIARKIKMGYSK